MIEFIKKSNQICNESLDETFIADYDDGFLVNCPLHTILEFETLFHVMYVY